MSAAAPRYLHVANGTSTTRTIEAAGIPGARSIWADVLYEGPVPSGGDDQVLEARLRFHEGGEGALDPVNDMREWRAVMARHTSYDELVLWFEHDLFDQLALIQLLSWIRGHLPAEKPVSLICIGSFPGRPDFRGLGELTPGELGPLFDQREAVNPAQYEIAERAWTAFREPSPEALDALRFGDSSALPYLSAALERLLQEYPWTTDGLSCTERRMLELARGDGVELIRAFARMHEGETAYYATDGTIASTAETLASTSPPLLVLDKARSAHRALPGHIALTPAGASVLAGTLDRVSLGIDRWIGGVHLRDGGPMWRWDPRQQRLVSG